MPANEPITPAKLPMPKADTRFFFDNFTSAIFLPFFVDDNFLMALFEAGIGFRMFLAFLTTTGPWQPKVMVRKVVALIVTTPHQRRSSNSHGTQPSVVGLYKMTVTTNLPNPLPRYVVFVLR
mmetsp:Transcript_2189/g.3216  ORF Transcript_2189/g.3216 Transcript_2189/m.3216 type:complete len:122 (-) Transcript_2189:4-369(-)